MSARALSHTQPQHDRCRTSQARWNHTSRPLCPSRSVLALRLRQLDNLYHGSSADVMSSHCVSPPSRQTNKTWYANNFSLVSSFCTVSSLFFLLACPKKISYNTRHNCDRLWSCTTPEFESIPHKTWYANNFSLVSSFCTVSS